MAPGDELPSKEEGRLLHKDVAGDLQVIASLIDMRMTVLEDEESLQVLREVRSLVQSMALAHGTIYESGTGGRISARRLMEKLIKSTRLTHCTRTWIETVVDAGTVQLPAGVAVPLALAVSECIRESVVCSLKGMTEGRIFVTVREEDDGFTVAVADSGRSGYDMVMDDDEAALGMMVADHIVRYRLKGTLERDAGDGASRVIRFPKHAPAP